MGLANEKTVESVTDAVETVSLLQRAQCCCVNGLTYLEVPSHCQPNTLPSLSPNCAVHKDAPFPGPSFCYNSLLPTRLHTMTDFKSDLELLLFVTSDAVQAALQDWPPYEHPFWLAQGTDPQAAVVEGKNLLYLEASSSL